MLSNKIFIDSNVPKTVRKTSDGLTGVALRSPQSACIPKTILYQFSPVQGWDVDLWKNVRGNTVKLTPGTMYSFPFAFKIHDDCPPSIDGCFFSLRCQISYVFTIFEFNKNV